MKNNYAVGLKAYGISFRGPLNACYSAFLWVIIHEKKGVSTMSGEKDEVFHLR